jgi:hypothetical protein
MNMKNPNQALILVKRGDCLALSKWIFKSASVWLL